MKPTTHSSARLIVTQKCRKNCPQCCNKYGRIMSQACTLGHHDISWLAETYNTICITGGEPMMFPEQTLELAKRLRSFAPMVKLYLYTAWYPQIAALDIVNVFDGVQFSLHAGPEFCVNDVVNLGKWEWVAACNPQKSFRLYVDAAISSMVPITPQDWKSIRIEKWKTEEELLAMQPGGLPSEDLYILDREF